MNNLSIPAPLFRDPIYDGPSDPVMIWNRTEKCWWLIYTQRRSTEVAIGVSNVFGSALGIASSADGQYWTYRGTIPGLDLDPGHNTFWAPEAVWLNGRYHMYVTYIQGIQFDWDHGYKPSKLAHFVSDDLWHWEFESFSQVSERPVIDACVHEIAPGQFKMWFKEDNNTYAAVSDDLCKWTPVGCEISDVQHEGPNVFTLGGKNWMITDMWHGLAVYSTEDFTHWTRQPENILEQPGTRPGDQLVGHHADVLMNNGHAYIIYFTHKAEGSWSTQLQAAELLVEDGKLVCHRDRPQTWELVPET